MNYKVHVSKTKSYRGPGVWKDFLWFSHFNFKLWWDFPLGRLRLQMSERLLEFPWSKPTDKRSARMVQPNYGLGLTEGDYQVSCWSIDAHGSEEHRLFDSFLAWICSYNEQAYPALQPWCAVDSRILHGEWKSQGSMLLSPFNISSFSRAEGWTQNTLRLCTDLTLFCKPRINDSFVKFWRFIFSWIPCIVSCKVTCVMSMGAVHVHITNFSSRPCTRTKKRSKRWFDKYFAELLLNFFDVKIRNQIFSNDEYIEVRSTIYE